MIVGSDIAEVAISVLLGKCAYDSGRKLLSDECSSRRDFLKHLGIVAGGTVAAASLLHNANGVSDERTLHGLLEANNLRMNVLPLPGIGLRDAIVAKKVSEYLVPLNRKKGMY